MNTYRYRTEIQRVFLWMGLILCSFSSEAQGDRRVMLERMEAQRAAYITNALQLTSKEAEVFWPIYNEYKAEERKLRQELNQLPGDKSKISVLTNEEARALTIRRLDMEGRQLEIKRKYFSKLMDAIPPQKIAILPEAERGFRERVVRRVSEGPPGRRRINPISAPSRGDRE